MPSEGPLMRRRSVMMAVAAGSGREGGDWRRGGYWQTGPTSVRLRRRESPRAVVGETFWRGRVEPQRSLQLKFSNRNHNPLHLHHLHHHGGQQ